MAGDSLTQRVEAVERRPESLRELAQATPGQQPLLAAAAEDLALGSFRKTPILLYREAFKLRRRLWLPR